MPRYLDPKAYVVFYKIFCEHPKLLISFLNAILPLPADRPIVSLTYLSSEQTPKIPMFRNTIGDVKCEDSSGRCFIVEMEIDWIGSFKHRLLFESGQAFIKQLEKGEDFHSLQPVYGVGLLATNFDESEHWYHHYQLVNVSKPTREILEHLQLVFIELKKFPISSPDKKRLRILWLRFLREITDKTEQISKDLFEVPEISQAIELAQEATYNNSELTAYDDYWFTVSTQRSMMSGKFREGEKKGKADALLQVARQMKNRGCPTRSSPN